MIRHPATLMLGTWALAWVLLLFVLPMHLTRPLTPFGLGVLGAFIGIFCLGTILPRGPRVAPATAPVISNDLADELLAYLALIALVASAVDMIGSGSLDLASRYVLRAQVSQDLFYGRPSNSSLAFKIAFLTYPAGYVYLARRILFAGSAGWFRTLVLGLGPSVASAITSGGRMSIFYGIVIGAVALLLRHGASQRRISRSVAASGVTIAAVASWYAAKVFLVRAARSGGSANLLAQAPSDWGVAFDKGTAWSAIVGPTLTFLLFLAGWYFVQGLAISNQIFSGYTGPIQWGVNGADVILAIVRRLDPALMVHNFQTLKAIGIYGLLPSAFGSLFVDFRWGGLPIALGWGYAAGLVYRRKSPGWALAEPFLIAGILFSTLNTPIGLSNGLVTHAWLMLACLLQRRVKYAS